METDEHYESIIDSQPVDIALPNCDHDSIINEGNTHYMYQRKEFCILGAIGKKIQSLEQLLSLEKVLQLLILLLSVHAYTYWLQVQESFEKEEFECVVDILLPSLSEESYSKVSEWRKRKREGKKPIIHVHILMHTVNFFQFFLGTLQATNSKGSSKRHGVQYLIDSLYNLNRYTVSE